MVNKKIRGVIHTALDECLDALLHYEQLGFVKGEVVMKLARKDDKLYCRISTHVGATRLLPASYGAF